MRTCELRLCALASVLQFLRPAPTTAAEQAAPLSGDEAPLVVVVEEGAVSDGGAGSVRDILALQPGARVASLDESADKGELPRAVLNVSRKSANAVSVLYWDQRGSVDWLTAPIAAGDGEAAIVTASALASALLHRHLPGLVRACSGASSAPRCNGPPDLRQVLALLGHLREPRSQARIVPGDF